VFKIWLITGSSRGLGRDLAKAVLDAGHRLVATARKVETSAISLPGTRSACDRSRST